MYIYFLKIAIENFLVSVCHSLDTLGNFLTDFEEAIFSRVEKIYIDRTHGDSFFLCWNCGGEIGGENVDKRGHVVKTFCDNCGDIEKEEGKNHASES